MGNSDLGRRLLATDSAVLGPYLAAKGDHEPIMPLSIALRDSSGAFSGVLSVGIRITWLDRLGLNSELPTGAQLSIVDSSGLVYATVPRLPDVTGTRIPGLAALIESDLRTISSERGVTIRRTREAIPRLVAYHRLASDE